MPASYNGTKSFTGLRVYEERVGIPDTPRAIHCRKVYEAYTHQKLNRDSVAWGVAMGNCNFVDLFVRAAAKAGNNLNSRGLSAALQSLGRVDVCVPHDPGKPCVDDGQRFNSLSCGLKHAMEQADAEPTPLAIERSRGGAWAIRYGLAAPAQLVLGGD